MHRPLFPKILVLLLVCPFLFNAGVAAQKKPAAEVDLTKCWSYPLGDAAARQFASDASRVFLGLDGAKIDALSLDGKKIWATELGGELGSNILAADAGLFLVTSTVSPDAAKPSGSVLRALSAETGVTNWTLKLPDAEKYFLNGFNGSVIVVSDRGIIQSIDAKSGALKWKREISEGFAAEPAFNGDKAAIATNGKRIFNISLATGEIESIRKVPFAITALGKTPSGDIVAGDERGNVSLLLADDDKPYWSFKSGGEIADVLAAGDHLLVTSNDNFVYFLLGRNGARAWKKRFAGRVSQIANVMDRYALISGFEEHAAVLVDLANAKVAGQIAFGDNESIVSTPIVSNGIILILTNEASYAYSITGCGGKK